MRTTQLVILAGLFMSAQWLIYPHRIFAESSMRNAFDYTIARQKEDPLPDHFADNCLTEEHLEELRDFYSNEDFHSNLYAEIRMTVMIAKTGTIGDAVKDVLPDRCDHLLDRIATIVHQETTSILLDGPKDIERACPYWSSLSLEDRKNFYVALVTAMAFAESSCNNNAKARSPNGTAFGLWQGVKPMSYEQGCRWVMQQLHRQVKQSGLLFWPNSHRNYWAVLNPNIQAHKVQRILKRIPACAIRALAAVSPTD